MPLSSEDLRAMGWRRIDWRHDPIRGTEGTDPALGVGVIRAVLKGAPRGQAMAIERIAVSCNSSADTELTAYIGSVDDSNHVDFTGAGNRDVADEFQAVLVPGGKDFILEWSGADAGSIATALIQFAVYDTGDRSR